MNLLTDPVFLDECCGSAIRQQATLSIASKFSKLKLSNGSK